MGFSRQEYWSGLSFPSRGDLSDPEIEPMSLTSPALAGGFFAQLCHIISTGMQFGFPSNGLNFVSHIS